VVRELVSKFTEGNAAAERALHRDKMPGSLALEVLDPATLPATPVSPNRPAAAAIGLLAGMLLGSLLALRRRLVARPSAAPTVRRSAPPVASPACCWASPSHAHAAARLTQQRLDTGSRSLRALPPARSAS
jgi:hypothetical protein